MSGSFKAVTARVHLAVMKRNGLWSSLCDVTDDHAESRRVEFHELIKEKQAEKAEKERKRKCQAAHMDEQEDAEVQIIERKKRRHRKK